MREWYAFYGWWNGISFGSDGITSFRNVEMVYILGKKWNGILSRNDGMASFRNDGMTYPPGMMK